MWEGQGDRSRVKVAMSKKQFSMTLHSEFYIWLCGQMSNLDLDLVRGQGQSSLGQDQMSRGSKSNKICYK